MEINFNEEKIQARLKARRAEKAGIPLESITPTEVEDNNAPIEHSLTPKVRAALSVKLNLWLTGPAGSGKSKCAELVAKSLSLPYFAPPIGRETTNAQLFGYFNVQGEYVRTPIREACEKGGVLHLEEIDFASPSVGTALNALLANDEVGFPDRVVTKHEDFIVIASANTYGAGANAQYIGSQGLNAATLNRFVFMDFPYDEKMERRLATNKSWVSHVQSVRKAVEKIALKQVVSPRDTIYGCKLLSTKVFTWEEIEGMTIYKGLPPSTVEKIKAALRS